MTTQSITSITQFADEETESSYGYLSGYNSNPTLEENIRDLGSELATLRNQFSKLVRSDFDRSCVDRIQRGEIYLPKGAERWTLIPRWDKIAPTYGEAVEKVLLAVSTERKGKFFNWRDGQLGPQYLRQHERTIAMLKKLGDQQKYHDILVLPAQFGLRHRGRSVRRSREVFNGSEFGLGAFAVGIMILTHPERLEHREDLWIDCTGDEFAPMTDGGFSHAPYFVFSNGRVEFGTHWFGLAYEYFGSASSFLSQ